MARHEKSPALKRTILLLLTLNLSHGAAAFEGHKVASRSQHHRLSKKSFPHLVSENSRDAISDNSTIVARGVDAWAGASYYEQKGTSGIGAMQMTVVNDRYVVLFDKAEQNPLRTSDGNHAWAAILDTYEGNVRALKTETNSFCAGERDRIRSRQI
jgi:hypothetical protein